MHNICSVLIDCLGYGRCLVYRHSKGTLKNYPTHTPPLIDRIDPPPIDPTTQRPQYRHAVLDNDGIVFAGAHVHNKQVMINRRIPVISDDSVTPTGTTAVTNATSARNVEYRDAPISHKNTIPAYAERVLLTSNQDEAHLFKILLRNTRRPELGDKFSSRHGQKGVCGLIAQQEDMPFTDSGIVPDMIMNPHGYPSRMTVGKLMELLSGKNAVMCGRFHDGTAFGGDQV